MPYAQFDDGFCDHPKVEGLSDAAFRLHVAGVCYCSRLLTDGVIPMSRVHRLVVRYRPKMLAELTSSGVWHERGHDCICPQPPVGSILVHSYLDHNRSRFEVEADRAGAAERQRRYRARNASRDAVTNGVSHASPSSPLHATPDNPPKPPRLEMVTGTMPAALRREARNGGVR